MYAEAFSLSRHFRTWEENIPAALVTLAHLAVATRYDFFRDELYFIACGRSPQWGYADQPPGVPLIAAATQVFGESLFLLRLVPALAAGATVIIVARLARELGADRRGVLLAACATACVPMYRGLESTLNTSSFEPLLWTWIALCAVRRHWILVGVLSGIDLQLKYEVPIFLAPLAIASYKRLDRRIFIGAALMLVIAAPSLIWQLAHGLPFRTLMQAAASGKNVVLQPHAFVINQILVMNIALAPLWIAGLFRRSFLSAAFGLTFVALLLMHAKDYYVAPAYGLVIALGAVVFQRSRVATYATIAAAFVMVVVASPMSMPILDPPVLTRYIAALGVESQPSETLDQAEIPQHFADQFGWRELAREVEHWHAMYPDAAIVASNYGEAGAIDFYTPLQALSGHNQYGLWGTRGFIGSRVIALRRSPEQLERYCSSAAQLGTFGAPYAMPFERNAPISLCTLKKPLADVWDTDVAFMY